MINPLFSISFLVHKIRTFNYGAANNGEQCGTGTLPLWPSSSLKSRNKSYIQSIPACLSKLNMDSPKNTPPTVSPVTSDEKFKHENHSQLILAKMNQYYQTSKLKDVTLIAGATFIKTSKNHFSLTK